MGEHYCLLVRTAQNISIHPGEQHFTGASYATWGSGRRCRRRTRTVFFHEVNLLLEDDCNLYICDIFPAHVSVAVDVQLQVEGEGLLARSCPSLYLSICMVQTPVPGAEAGRGRRGLGEGLVDSEESSSWM